jgi:hypothetical protein
MYEGPGKATFGKSNLVRKMNTEQRNSVHMRLRESKMKNGNGFTFSRGLI